MDVVFVVGTLLDDLLAAAHQRTAFPKFIGQHVAFGHYVDLQELSKILCVDAVGFLVSFI